ncbi:MAG: DUF2341 domain-containing protein, partial [Candidatus Aenigmatarchaeota archaeon]
MKKNGYVKKIKNYFSYFLICLFIFSYFILRLGISIKSILLFLLLGTWLLFFLEKRKKMSIVVYPLIFSIIFVYKFIIGNIPIILAATPIPSPPTVVDSPDPQQGGGTITFSCSPNACQPGASGELIKLLICKSNSAACVLGSQWSYRRPIIIDNTQNSNTLTDYQVLVINPIYNETGLIASWHFNEGSGTIALDSSGNNNNGNLVNGPTWVNGKFGKALSFDGVDDYVSTTNQFSNPQTFSLVIWFKTTSASGRKIIGFENTQTGTGSTNYDRHLYVGTDGKLYFGVYDGSTRTISTTTTVTDGSWHFAVATFSSNVMRLYLDGNFVGSLSTGGAQNFNGWWRIGSYKCAGWPNCGDGYFPGIIDEVRIYNRALSDTEIQALYQAKARLDYGDIRFTDSDGTQLNYWQEADGKFWVKIPSIPASSTKTIYVYYGNPYATSLSNGDNTFDFFEDFSTDPNTNNKWEVYRYSADTVNEFVYDSANKRVYLTKAANSKGVMAFFKNKSTPNGFVLTTKGGGGGGSGADGWAFGFFKDISPYRTYGRAASGGTFGLMAYDGTNNQISKGYAVEFDNYQNTNDPSGNHNALVKTDVASPYTHLAYYNTNLANEDNAIHNIEITFFNDTVTLKVDGTQHFSYSGTIDKTYTFLGFGAGTGGYNNNH